MSTRLIKILHKSVNKICSLLTWDGFDFTGTHALVWEQVKRNTTKRETTLWH